jgi:pre-mRNA-splicing factor 18
MNAMEILRNEINKKRKLASDLIEKNKERGGDEGEEVGDGKEKKIRYFRQSDLIKEKERVALEMNSQLELRKQEQQRQRNEHEEEREERGRQGREGNEQSDKNSNETSDERSQTAMLNSLSLLTIDEIKHRLRGLGHPVTFFGETVLERIQRLVTAQLEEDDDNMKNDDYRLTAIGHDTNHHSHQQDRDDTHHRHKKGGDQKGTQDEEEEDDEEEKDQTSSSSYIRGNICTNYSSPSSGLSSEKIIYKYFRNLLKQWEWDLDDREDYLKQTAKGKMETKTQKQCKDYIRPLFKLCKRKEVPGDILIKLVKVSSGSTSHLPSLLSCCLSLSPLLISSSDCEVL